MDVAPTQIAIGIALLVTALFAGYLGLLGRARSVLTDRFVLGVPWGTILCTGLVLAFYLFAQGGLSHWGEPVTLPYRSWSYFSVLGMLAAGFAHGSPGHITGNLLGTVVLAPIVEYAWSHYPPEETKEGLSGTSVASDSGVLDRPWIRAIVVFPAVVIVVSLVTSVFAMFFSLGFSGTVFAFGGMALVYYPIRTVVGMLGISVFSLVYRALTQPVLTATAEAGPPGPPGWVGINQQAHILGLLIGALLGVALLIKRDRRPDPGRLFVAALFFTVARGLYLLWWVDGDTFSQYRGLGLIAVLLLTMFVTAAAVTRDQPLTGPLGPRVLGVGWLGLVGLGALGGVWLGLRWEARLVGLLVLAAVLGILLSVPALYLLSASVFGDARITNRQAVTGILVVVTVAVALLSVPFNLFVLADDPVPGSGGVEVRDYTVTYAENVSAPRLYMTDTKRNVTSDGSGDGGVVVVSERRELWSVAVSKDDLARQGNVTVPLGSLRWRETVTAERTGWAVTGNDSVYVVDLQHDDTQTRSFVSDASTAEPRISGYNLTLAPAGDQFEVRVRENGRTVNSALVPEANASTTAAGVGFSIEQRDGTDHLVARQDGTSVAIATREHG